MAWRSWPASGRCAGSRDAPPHAAAEGITPRGGRTRVRAMWIARSEAEGFDLGHTRPGTACARHGDADAVGRERRERHGLLDEVVAADRPEDDPRRAVPSFD